MKNKVAFIGPESIHAGLSQVKEDWDFQQPITSLEEFERELKQDVPDKFDSENTSIIIFFSRLFEGEQDQKLFSYLVAFLSPYSAVMILHPSIDGEETKDYIIERVKRELEVFSEEDSNYHIESPFYFVDYDNYKSGIDEAITKYIRDPLANERAAKSIRDSLPEQSARALERQNREAEEYLEQNDEIVIPERNPESDGRVLAITSSKGGSGKSSVTMLVAAYLAKASRDGYEKGLADKPLKVCVVDFDVRDGQLGFLNGQQSPNIISILADTTEELTEANVKKGIYHSKNMECDFIFAAKRPRYSNAIPTEFYVSLIQKLREMYDYILLDTSVDYRDPLLEQVAYPMADKILFVSDMGISSIYGMRRWEMETTMMKDNPFPVDPDKTAVIINKYLTNVNMEVDRIQDSVSMPIISVYPSDPKLLTFAANNRALEQVLNSRYFNEMTKRIVETVVEPTGYQLGTVPFVVPPTKKKG